MKMNPVVHFELPYEDRERMADFYGQAFGWTANMLGPEMGEYVVVMTSEADEKGFPKRPGMINGGFYRKSTDSMGKCPSVVIAVDDIQAAMDRVAKVGGKIMGKPDSIPEVGLYVSFMDTEGNRLALLQPDKKM